MTGHLRCEDCKELFYSAAAAHMVERRERCEHCGGRLWHTERPPAERPHAPLDLASALAAAGEDDADRQQAIARVDEILRIDPARIPLR